MSPSKSSDPPPSTELPPPSILTSRAGKQLSLFIAGTAFVGLSTFITRRSLIRRYKATIPHFYHPSNRPPQVNGAMEAFEALNIATINVLSVSMMFGGGLLWGLDIWGLEDMRRRLRGGLGFDGSGRSEKDAEEEFEEWLATVLARKEKKVEAKGKKGKEIFDKEEKPR